MCLKASDDVGEELLLRYDELGLAMWMECVSSVCCMLVWQGDWRLGLEAIVDWLSDAVVDWRRAHWRTPPRATPCWRAVLAGLIITVKGK